MSKTNHAYCGSLLNWFCKDRRGSIGVFYALSAIPLLGMAGIAIDYSRVVSTRGELQRAIDSATATASRFLADEDDARSTFDANFKANLSDGLKQTTYTLEINDDKGTLIAHVTHPVAMSVMSIFGYKKIDVAVEATGHRPALREKPNPTPKEVDEIIEKSNEDDLKKQIISDIKERYRKLRRSGANIPEISEDKLDKFAEQLARKLKR